MFIMNYKIDLEKVLHYILKNLIKILLIIDIINK